MLKTLQAPPPKGSLQECALILLLDRLEDIEHARFRALAQIVIDKEKGVEAFEDYLKLAFPSLALRKKEREQEIHKALKAWTGAGPLKVTPLSVPTGRSRMKMRVAKVTDDERSNRFYQRLSKKT